MIKVENNIVIIHNNLSDCHPVISSIYRLIYNEGYKKIVLDFSQCKTAFQWSMTGIVARILAEKRKGVKFEIRPPLSRACPSSDLTNKDRVI
jgi:hypothetical protein